MSDLTLDGCRVIALGERDGIAGESLNALLRASGSTIVMSATECFV